MLTGRVDEFQNGKIYGWAFNEDQPDEHLLVRVMRGPQVIATGVANIVRRDLAEGGMGEGDHAFEIAAPPNVVSFHSLMIVAQSQRHGEIPLPIATTDERRFDEMFSLFSERYEEALVTFKEEFDALKQRCDVLESEDSKPASSGGLPEDLTQRLVSLETRLDAAEVFILRIDETLRKIVEDGKSRKRKRFLGIF
jgi:hypothetical protein